MQQMSLFRHFPTSYYQRYVTGYKLMTINFSKYDWNKQTYHNDDDNKSERRSWSEEVIILVF